MVITVSIWLLLVIVTMIGGIVVSTAGILVTLGHKLVLQVLVKLVVMILEVLVDLIDSTRNGELAGRQNILLQIDWLLPGVDILAKVGSLARWWHDNNSLLILALRRLCHGLWRRVPGIKIIHYLILFSKS